MTRLALLLFSLMTSAALAVDDAKKSSELEGAWQLFGNVTKDEVTIATSTPRSQFLIRGDKITFLFEEKDYIGIPYHGATIEVTIDRSKTPHRLAMTFYEGGMRDEDDEPEVFAYCIYRRSGDKLMLKVLMPLALASNGKKKDFERFATDPYPQDFSPVSSEFEGLMLFQKTKDIIPIPKDDE